MRMIVTENTQATLDRLILVLAEAVNSLADAVENGALEDKHNAAKWVEEVAGRVVSLTGPTIDDNSWETSSDPFHG